jgi:uncharacterized protein YqeY
VEIVAQFYKAPLFVTINIIVIQDQIKKELKEAMLNREATRLSVVRGMLAAFVNELVTLKRSPQANLSDEEALGVIRRLAKQRKDSAEQFRNGGRPELAAKEEEELLILDGYLPTMMNKDDIRKIAETKKAELGITDKSKIGILMGAIMKNLKGKADGADVKEVIETLFNKQ